MAVIAKIPVVWDGLPGLPGVSVHYSLGTDATAAVAALVAFFNAGKGNFPTGLSWQVPSSGDTINDANGALSGTWSGASGSTIAANGGTGTYASGVGYRVKWRTAGLAAHKRVVGSTFLVPLLGSLYASNGTIAGGTVTSTQTAANTLVAASVLRIWHRGPKGASAGASYVIQTAEVPQKVATLRSRRV